MENKIIGNYLKKVRLKKGYSEEYLSFKLNVSQSTISNFENGKIKMDVTRLIEFCNVLDIHIQELVNALLEIHYAMKGSGPDIPPPMPAAEQLNLAERIDRVEQLIKQQHHLLSRISGQS